MRRRGMVVGDVAAGRHLASTECGRQAGGRLEGNDLRQHLDAVGIETRLSRFTVELSSFT